MAKRQVKTIPTQANAPVTWMNIRTIGAVLFVLAFLIYSNSIFNGFVLDDKMVISKNAYTVKGFAGLGKIFTSNTFEGFYGEDAQWIDVYGARYRPLSIAGFAIIHQFAGDNPFVYHFWNVLLYAFCCAFLFRVLQRVFENRIERDQSILLAGVATLLYTVHPIHTEVVANIKSNDEILSMLLSFAALNQAVRYVENGLKVNALWSGLLLFFGLLAKENAVTFLAVIPLTIWMMNRPVKSIWPLAVSLGSALIIYLIIRTGVTGAVFSGPPPMDLINNPFVKVVNDQWAPLAMPEQLAMTFYSLGKYIQLLFLPVTLTTDYYPRYVEVMTFSNPGAVISLVVYLALGIFILVQILAKRLTPVVYGGAFFLITLSIVSNLFFPIGTNLAERFMFMPSLGFCLVLAGLLLPIISGGKFRKPVMWTLAIVALLFAGRSFGRNFDFKDNKTLFSKDIQVSAKSAKIQHAYGAIIAEEGLKATDPQERNRLAQEAKIHLDEAIKIHPTYLEAFYMRGNVQFMLGHYEDAVQDYRMSLKLNPNFRKAFTNYALALREAARAGINTRTNVAQAISYLEESLKMFPNEPETQQLLEAAKGMQ